MSNRVAFLAMIGACEGADYDTLVGGGKFVGFDDHPRQRIVVGTLTSTAAGRYQILAGTWDDFIRDRGRRKFDQQGQDECAVWLINRRGALADVDAGRLEAAIAKCSKEWASFPGSPYGQKTRSLTYCLGQYTAAGGGLADAPTAAPIEDDSTEAPMAQDSPNPFASLLDLAGPIATIFNPLAGALISAFTPLAKEKLTKEINRHTDNPAVGAQVADGVIAAAQKLTNLLDPVDAVAAARKDPAVMAQIEASALDQLDKLAPLFDKLAEYDGASWAAEEASKSAAAMRAKTSDPILTDRPFIVSLIVLLMIGALSASVVFMPAWTQDNRTQVLQAFLMALSGILGFWIGSSRSSSAKDAVISEMARR